MIWAVVAPNRLRDKFRLGKRPFLSGGILRFSEALKIRKNNLADSQRHENAKPNQCKYGGNDCLKKLNAQRAHQSLQTLCDPQTSTKPFRLSISCSPIMTRPCIKRSSSKMGQLLRCLRDSSIFAYHLPSHSPPQS